MPSAPATPAIRINSIDVLRGIVMVVMALDHARDFFSGFKYEPTDLAHASTVMFLTRFVTHYCAPVFVFLSGTSAYLSAQKQKESGAVNSAGWQRTEAWKLLTRGLWLIVLEHTIVRFGWMFDLNYSFMAVQVIWAIGVSMVALSGLIFLPRWLVLGISLAMIAGHNLLDGMSFTGAAGVVWQFLHVQGPVPYGQGNTIVVIYPLIPWIGVMAAGFCFGVVFQMEAAVRNKWLYGTGLGAIALFIIIRGTNLYGDPDHWQMQGHWWRTLFSFVNCTKYPPSLLYLLITLGPAIAAMPLLERMSGAAGGVMKVFGRVPMFYYILHIYLIHGMAVAASAIWSHAAQAGVFDHPGYRLWVVYGVWLAAVVLLYFPCRWYMRIKMTHRKWWLSYL